MVKEEEECFLELENLLTDVPNVETIDEIRKFTDLVWTTENDVVLKSQDNDGSVRVH